MRPPCTRTPGLLQRGFLALLTATATTTAASASATAVAPAASAAKRGFSTAGGSFSRAVESFDFFDLIFTERETEGRRQVEDETLRVFYLLLSRVKELWRAKARCSCRVGVTRLISQEEERR